MTVEDSPGQSGLLGLLWPSSNSVKALRCVWAHHPAALGWTMWQLSSQAGVSSVQVSFTLHQHLSSMISYGLNLKLWAKAK